MAAQSHKTIVRMQYIWQYILLGWFVLVTVLMLLQSEIARTLAVGGVGLIVLATVMIVSEMALHFRRTGHRRGVWLCAVMIMLLALTVLLSFIQI